MKWIIDWTSWRVIQPFKSFRLEDILSSQKGKADPSPMKTKRLTLNVPPFSCHRLFFLPLWCSCFVLYRWKKTNKKVLWIKSTDTIQQIKQNIVTPVIRSIWWLTHLPWNCLTIILSDRHLSYISKCIDDEQDTESRWGFIISSIITVIIIITLDLFTWARWHWLSIKSRQLFYNRRIVILALAITVRGGGPTTARELYSNEPTIHQHLLWLREPLRKATDASRKERDSLQAVVRIKKQQQHEIVKRSYWKWWIKMWAYIDWQNDVELW